MDGNFTLKGINKGAINSLNNKPFCEKGAYFITTAAACPDGDYYGFKVGSGGATITSIDYGDYASLYGGTLSNYSFVNGETYYIKFKSITISAGTLMCLKA